MRTIALTTILTAIIAVVLAQAPQGISHQAVIRNAANELVTNSPIGIKVSILQGSPEGTVVYSETHLPTSNANGLISFVIGQGTVESGLFSEIDWASGPYFFKTETDPAGGTNYTITGTSQVWSIPYTLFSQKSATLKDGSVPGEILYWSGQQWVAIQPGEHNQVLRLCNGVPTWGDCRYLLTLVSSPQNGGVVNGAGKYHEGAQINISAQAGEGWEFVNWTDGDEVVSQLPDFLFTMPATNITLTANFVEEQGGFTCGNAFTDSRDGKTYNTVQIGNQCWMQENLKYLPEVVGPGSGSDIVPYYYVYDYDGTNVSEATASGNYQTYGALYNWPASLTACPTGWHLPSDDEWTALTTYVSSQPTYLCNSNTSDISKSLAATTNWNTSSNTCAVGNNLSANNATGFSGLPGGSRSSDGSFFSMSYVGRWWSSTEDDATKAWYRNLHFNYSYVYRFNYPKGYGFSVRCLKN